MGKRTKVWTAVGVAVLAGSGAVANPIKPMPVIQSPYFILADGEGGAAGGEGGGISDSNSYALQSTDANAYNYDAKPQIAAYIDHVRKSYGAAVTAAAALDQAIDRLLLSPSDQSLADARQAWLAARPFYLRTEAFRFYNGPIDAVESEINSWPMNEAYVDYVEGNPSAGLINDPQSKLDVDSLEALNQKQDEADVTIGWHAIEFLLWGQDKSATGPGNRPMSDYVAGQGNNDRRRAYLKLLSAQLVKEMQSLVAAWDVTAPKSYGANFAALPPREAIGRIINGMAILAGYEMMSERMGVALDSGDQEDEQSCFSDSTKQDFVEDMAGIADTWRAAKLDALLVSLDPVLAKQVDAAMADAQSRLAVLGNPWDQVLAASSDSQPRKEAEAAVASLQGLADVLKKAGNKLGVLVLIPTE